LPDFSLLETVPASEILKWAMVTFGDSFAIATGFQKEGMVLVDLAAKIAPEIGQRQPRVFTLDTGRLPPETYEMMDNVRQRYGVAIEVVFPEREAVERMVAEHGANLFYDSVEARAMCCRIRKVEPLERKL
jgi:phosphoadenosine phosphosulfate reductase